MRDRRLVERRRGGGEYGGLSLTQKDWEAHGGLDYATSPDQASRSQQIAVAQKVLAAEGIGAWGTCGLTSGLTQENGALNVDTGVADDSSDSSDSSGSSGLSDLSRGLSGSSGSTADDDSSTGSSDSSADSAGSPSASAYSPSSSSAATGESGTSGGRSDGSTGDGSPTATPGADDSDKYVQDEGSWSLVDTGSLGSGKHRGATADEAATKSATDAGVDGTAAASAGRHAAATYVVQEGDSLASIADSLGLDGGWRALYDENRDLIGVDPSNIAAGQTLDTGVE